MSNSMYIKLGAAASIAFVIMMFFSTYNTIVEKEELVIESWSQVESVLQRKLDLIPNLVKTVKSYAKHEKDVFTEITKARSTTFSSLKGVSSGKLPTAAELKVISSLNKNLNQSIFKLMAVSEKYPNLKASQNFLSLQTQLEGSENRINITRMHFNSSVKDYNAYIRKMPTNIVSVMAGFSRKAYFKADKEAHEKMDIDL